MRKFQLAAGIALLTLMSVDAWAQGVEVNQKDWAGLSATDQEKITEILKATKLLAAQEEITPSEAARPSAEIVAELAATPEAADTVEINASEWSQLAPNERDQITEIMRATKLIGADQVIVPSEKAPPSREKIAQSPRAAAPTTPQRPAQCYVRDSQGRTRVIPCPAGTELVQPEFGFGLGNLWCRTACDVAAGVAAAACTGLSSGVAVAVCLAAAEAGRQYCRSQC